MPRNSYGDALRALDSFMYDLREKRASATPNDPGHHPVDEAPDGLTDVETSDFYEETSPTDVPGLSTEDAPDDIAQTESDGLWVDGDLTGEGEGYDSGTPQSLAEHKDPGGYDGESEHVTADYDGAGDKTSSASPFSSMVAVDRLIRHYGAEKVAEHLGGELLADITQLVTAHDIYNMQKRAAMQKQAEYEDYSDYNVDAFNKEAAAVITSCVDDTINSANADAENLAHFYAGLVKGAADAEALPPEMASDMEAIAGGEGVDPELAAEMAATQEGAVPDTAEELAGGEIDPSVLADAAGDPGMAAAEGGGGEEETMAAISDALEQAGITPEQLAEAVAAEQEATPAPIEEKLAAVKNAFDGAEAINAYRIVKSLGGSFNKTAGYRNARSIANSAINRYFRR